jgi:peptidoglycan biosynthesis protein MviN/MurJ (putative lipid II flippase)
MRAAVQTVSSTSSWTVLLVTPLWLRGVEPAHGGISLATALAGVANTALLWRYLRKDDVCTGPTRMAKLAGRSACLRVDDRHRAGDPLLGWATGNSCIGGCAWPGWA